jgi:hypothetical protein
MQESNQTFKTNDQIVPQNPVENLQSILQTQKNSTKTKKQNYSRKIFVFGSRVSWGLGFG